MWEKTGNFMRNENFTTYVLTCTHTGSCSNQRSALVMIHYEGNIIKALRILYKHIEISSCFWRIFQKLKSIIKYYSHTRLGWRADVIGSLHTYTRASLHGIICISYYYTFHILLGKGTRKDQENH